MNRRTFVRSAALLAALSKSLHAQASLRTVRIGVFGLFRPSELIVGVPGDAAFTVDTGASTTVLRGRERIHVRLAGGAILAEHAGGRSRTAALALAGTGGDVALEIAVPDRIVRTFSGTLTVAIADGALQPVVTMPLEIAVASVVAAEQAAGAPFEALQAQAVAARSYGAAARGRHRGFDFCDTTHCQFLRGVPAASHPAARAVRQTSGLTLVFRGATVAALYSASCGGRTRSLADAGLAASGGYPYYAVECPQCAAHAPEWQRRLALDADTDRLEVERSETARIAVVRRNGWSAVPSTSFEATRQDTALVLDGRGHGHGIGLCQAGAAAMASEGATFPEILQHYYPGTTLDSRV